MTNDTLGLFDMTGRRVIVTGAGGLLGREFCRALVDLGATVLALDREPKVLDPLCDGTTIVPIVCDVSDPDDVQQTIRSVAESGTIDALVTSAAIDPKVGGDGGVDGGGSSFASYPLAAWELSLRVNLTGTFLVAQAVAGVMAAQDHGRGQGSIVTIASTYGLAAPDQRLYQDEQGRRQGFKPLDYPTTKAGIIGFTRALAAEYRETGIRVNSLTPGGAFNGQDEGFVGRYSARTILGRMAQPSEYRGAIAFLCSDASSYMTGGNLVVDGGWTAL